MIAEEIRKAGNQVNKWDKLIKRNQKAESKIVDEDVTLATFSKLKKDDLEVFVHVWSCAKMTSSAGPPRKEQWKKLSLEWTISF